MAKFKIPADISTLEGEKLSEALTEAGAALKEINGKPVEELSDEDIADGEALVGFISAGREEIKARDLAETARIERAEALRNFNVDGDEDGEEGEGEGEGGEGDPADGEAEGGEGEGEGDEGEAPAAAEETRVPVAASNKRRQSLAAKVNKGTSPVQKKAPVKSAARASLTAAANVSGIQAGKQYESLTAAGEAIKSSLSALPKHGKSVVRNSALSFTLPKDEFSQENRAKYNNDTELLFAASRESRLEGKSLVAAGGWGAPSEQALDFCELESIDGLYTGPEVQITRGGVQYTKGPSMADIVDAIEGFWDMTEATAEAGVEQKTALRPEVPEFEEERLDAVGVMVEAGLLLKKAWPELIERYAKMALTLHQWKLSRKAIKQIEAFTGPAVSAPNGFGNALDVFNILDTIALGARQRFFMSTKQTLEVLLPHWVKTIIRIDLSNRAGVPFETITDAQIDAQFSARNLKVQWLNAYQDLALDATSNLLLELPETVEAIMYPAGTYVRGVSDVISLDTIYDSVNLKKNDYVHLFVEQGTLMTNPCGEGLRVSFPLVANGQRAYDNIAKNFFQTPVVP
jgi:hypothetical protein